MDIIPEGIARSCGPGPVVRDGYFGLCRLGLIRLSARLDMLPVEVSTSRRHFSLSQKLRLAVQTSLGELGISQKGGLGPADLHWRLVLEGTCLTCAVSSMILRIGPGEHFGPVTRETSHSDPARLGSAASGGLYK